MVRQRSSRAVCPETWDLDATGALFYRCNKRKGQVTSGSDGTATATTYVGVSAYSEAAVKMAAAAIFAQSITNPLAGAMARAKSWR